MFETECGNCGRSYAMDPGCDYFEADDENSGESYGRFLLRAT